MASIQRPSAVPSLISKLRLYSELTVEDAGVLEAAVSGTREFRPDEDIVEEGSSPDYSSVLLNGFAGRYNLLLDGKRQITALHITGDFVDLSSFLMKPMDHGVTALTTCDIAMVPHEKLTRITEEHPRLARLLWLNTLVDGAIHRRWVFVFGRMPAAEHFAHLLCEMYLRLKQAGQTNEMRFSLPLSQAELGDCLGLSLVHTNRALQELRALDLVRWERDLVTIKNWGRLRTFAQFDPTYLRISTDPMAGLQSSSRMSH